MLLTKLLLPDFVKKLPKGRKYLRAYISYTAPQKLINIFYKYLLEKPIAISTSVKMTPLMIRLTIRPEAQAIKKKYDQLTKVNNANKRAKKSGKWNFYLIFDLVFCKIKKDLFWYMISIAFSKLLSFCSVFLLNTLTRLGSFAMNIFIDFLDLMITLFHFTPRV